MASKDSKQTPPKLSVGSYPQSTSETVRMSGPIQGKSDKGGFGGSYQRGTGNGK